MLLRAVVVGALLLPAPASAAWLRASTRHFTIYSNTSEDALRRQATDLEVLDLVMRKVHRTIDTPETVFNKVTLYVVSSIDAIERLSRRNVAGFYQPDITGSVAFTPRAGSGSGPNDLPPKIVLFHEYAHHFLLGNYAFAYPAWFSEGYAEFVSTLALRNGSYWLGGPANHRANALFFGDSMPMSRLFDPPTKMDARQTDAFYGHAWLLTHYVMFGERRRPQLAQYLQLFNAGTPSLEAAKKAFGDLKVLDRELDAYLRQSKIPALPIPQMTGAAAPNVDIRALTAGEAALIDERIVSNRGVDGTSAPRLYAKAKTDAAPYPKDAVAQGWLAEMAYDARQDADSEAAADRALAIDPASSQALRYKAMLHLRRAAQAGAADPAVWTEARSWLIRANHAEHDDAAVLELFYRSFLMQRAAPTKSAIAGLYRALEIVPQAPELRYEAARQLILDGKVGMAKAVLRPIAFDPHAGPGNRATQLLALLDAGRTGKDALDVLDRTAAATDNKE